jgi:hypothetical protein
MSYPPRAIARRLAVKPERALPALNPSSPR